MGVILGLGLGVPGFFYLRSPAWMLLWVGLFVALWRMAAYAEPVFEEANPVVAEARPTRVRPSGVSPCWRGCCGAVGAARS